MKSIIRAVVFDFDGTLVTGTNDGYFRCYQRAAIESGFEISYELTKIRVLEQWGKTPRMELESVLREELSLVDQALNIYHHLIGTDFFLADVVAIAGTVPMLAKLCQNGIEAIVISGMRKDILELLSKKLEFGFSKDNLISTIDTEDPLKQKTTGYHLARLIKERGWSKEELLVVGDAQSDLEMAKAQGIEALIVLTGILTKEEAVNLGVKTILPTVAELPEILLS